MLRVINIQVWRDSWGIRARNADRVIPTRSKHSQQPRGDWTVALPPDLPTTPNACGSPEACSLRQVPNSIRLSLHACLVVGARPGIRRARVCRFAAHAALGEQDHRFRRSFAIKNQCRAKKNHGFSVSHHSLALTNPPIDGLIRSTRPMRNRHARPLHCL